MHMFESCVTLPPCCLWACITATALVLLDTNTTIPMQGWMKCVDCRGNTLLSSSIHIYSSGPWAPTPSQEATHRGLTDRWGHTNYCCDSLSKLCVCVCKVVRRTEDTNSRGAKEAVGSCTFHAVLECKLVKEVDHLLLVISHILTLSFSQPSA